MALHEVLKGNIFALRGTFRQLKVGSSGTAVKGITSGSVTVDPASISGATTGETQVSITGVAVGDDIRFVIPATLEAGLAFAGAYVNGSGTVKIRLANVTAAPIDGASLSWTYVWTKLT